VGVLFILAAVSAVVGLMLYDPILNGPEYLIQGSAHANQVVLGAVMELILVVSAVGTATAMFPFLRKHNETIALWHVCFRFLEAIIITVGIIGVLSLLTLSREYVAAGAPDIAAFQASGTLLKAVHDWTFLLGPNFLSRYQYDDVQLYFLSIEARPQVHIHLGYDRVGAYYSLCLDGHVRRI